MYDFFFFGCMLGHTPVHVLDPMDVIFPSSTIDAPVIFFCVCITLFKSCDHCTLPISSPLKHRQTNHSLLEPTSEFKLLGKKDAVLLGNVKPKNHQKGGVKVNLCFGKKAPTPFSETKSRLFKLVE